MRYVQLVWGRQGRELLYSDAGNNLISIPLESTGGELHPGKPTRLFTMPASIGSIETSDGERFLVARADESAPGPSLRLVFGWPGMLKK